MVWSAVGSALGSFIGGVSANASVYKQYKYQQKLQQQAAQLNYDYSIKSAQNMSSATRQGLEKAGYNPMLAVQNGTSGANASFTSAGQATAPDYAGGMSAGVANAQAVQRLKNETQQAESISDANYANADKAKAEKAKIVEELPFVGKKAKADYMKTAMESAKLENDIHYQNEYLKYLRNSIELQRELGYAGFANAKDIAELQSGSSSIGIKGIGEIKFNPKSWFKRK